MDLLICAALSLVASILSARLGYSGASEQITDHHWQLFAIGFVLLYLSLKFYRIFLYHKYFSPLRYLPGPKDNHWFLGQALKQVNADTPMAFAVNLSRQNPEATLIRYLSLANTEIILVNSLEAHHQVLQTQNDLFERPNAIMRMIRRFSENGLASFERDEYRAHRKVLSACFTPDCLRKLEPVFKERAAQLTFLFDRAIKAGGGATTVIDCTDTFGRLALDVMGRALLGKNLSYLEHAEFDQDGNLVKGTQEYGFLDAHDAVFGPDKIGKVFTFLDCFFPIRWLPCNTNFDFLRATRWMNTTVQQLVVNRRKELEAAVGTAKHESTSRDILSFLIEESMPGKCAEGIEDKNIIGHVSHHHLPTKNYRWTILTTSTAPDSHGWWPRDHITHARVELAHPRH